MARLKEQYVNEIAPALNSKFGYKSVMQISPPGIVPVTSVEHRNIASAERWSFFMRHPSFLHVIVCKSRRIF